MYQPPPPPGPRYEPGPEPPTQPGHVIRPPSSRPWWHIALAALAAAVVAAGLAVALVLGLQGHTNTAHLTTENHRLASQVQTLQGQVKTLTGAESGLQTKQAKDYTAVMGDLVPLAQYSTSVCSSDLTGPNGPAQFWFLCTSKKPASSSG
jgi:uncharacterized protein YlxW (UPF0749 family)